MRRSAQTHGTAVFLRTGGRIGALGSVLACVVAAMLILAAAPAHAASKLIFESPAVRVFRNDYSPGVISKVHEHRYGRFIYVLAGGSIKVILRAAPGEKPPAPTLADLETGRVAWRGPEAHRIGNVGWETVRLLEVEVKMAEEKSCLAGDADDLGPPEGLEFPASGRPAFRNRWGTVIVHRVEKGRPLASPLPDRDRLIYWMSPCELGFTDRDGTARRLLRSAGALDWLGAGSGLAGVNEGPETVEAIELVLGAPAPPRRIVIKGLD